MLETIATLNTYAEECGITEVCSHLTSKQWLMTYFLIAEPDEFLRHRRRKCSGDEVYFVEKARSGFSGKLLVHFGYCYLPIALTVVLVRHRIQ